MKLLYLIIIFTFITACSETKNEPDVKVTANVETKPLVVSTPLNPATSTCDEIASRQINSRVDYIGRTTSMLGNDKVAIKDQYEKTSDFEIRKTREKAERSNELKAGFDELGTDGVLQFLIDDVTKYDADKELLTIRLENALVRTKGMSYSLAFARTESSHDSVPMAGMYLTHMETANYSVIFVNGDAIEKKLKKGTVTFTMNMKPQEAKDESLSMAFAGYVVDPHFRHRQNSKNITRDLSLTEKDITLFINLRCIFLIDVKDRHAVKTIDF